MAISSNLEGAIKTFQQFRGNRSLRKNGLKAFSGVEVENINNKTTTNLRNLS